MFDTEESKRRLEKIIFWEYDSGCFDILPPEVVAQRIIDRWAALDSAYQTKQIRWRDLITAVAKVDQSYDKVVYCESVREHIIKYLISTYLFGPPKP